MASRSPSGTKADAQQFHAINRLRQRYGVEITSDEYFRIVQLISKPGHIQCAHFIMKQSNRVSVWSVPYAGINLVAVYDRERKRICTFLPPHCSRPEHIGWMHFDNDVDAWSRQWDSGHLAQA